MLWSDFRFDFRPPWTVPGASQERFCHDSRVARSFVRGGFCLLFRSRACLLVCIHVVSRLRSSEQAKNKTRRFRVASFSLLLHLARTTCTKYPTTCELTFYSLPQGKCT